MKKINLDVQEAEYVVILEIADRAEKLGLIDHEMIVDATLDLVATHLNAVPLDLKAFASGSVANFRHDFLGIRRLISLRTGKFREAWTPIFAKREAA